MTVIHNPRLLIIDEPISGFDPININLLKKEYSQFIVGMPNMILSNGLGQTLAFLKAKSSKEERNFVFSVLKKYLLEEYKSDFTNVQDDFSFLEKINSISQSKYIKMQEEVLRMLEWLKRYARAFEQADKKE